jgi:hypothetical protein
MAAIDRRRGVGVRGRDQHVLNRNAGDTVGRSLGFVEVFASDHATVHHRYGHSRRTVIQYQGPRVQRVVNLVDHFQAAVGMLHAPGEKAN